MSKKLKKKDNNLDRVYILGTVGSGKTFLSKKLSNLLKIKHYDLDDLFWEKNIVKCVVKKKEESYLIKFIKKENGLLKGSMLHG